VNISRFLTLPVVALVLALTASAVAAKPGHMPKMKPGELQARLEAAVDFAPPTDLTLVVKQPNGRRIGEIGRASCRERV